MKHPTQLVVLLIWPIIATIISFAFRPHAFISQMLFLGVPCLLLAIYAPRYILKTVIFGGVFIPLWMFVEYVMHTTGQWYAISVFKTRFLGGMAYDALIWFFLVQFFVVMFWEYFFEYHTKIVVWPKRMTPLALSLAGFFFLTAGLYIWAPQFLRIPYFYLVLMITVYIIPLTLELKAHSYLFPKFLKLGAYFSYVFILYELTAIALGQWYFPSNQFIGWVQIFGQKFPFEEFISWILIGSMVCISWYEHFDDYRR
jgi:hypothetical protein